MTLATFAMGCFWSPDALLGSAPGVVRTRVGYAGGQLPDPTYAKLGDHTETVQVDYDPERTSYQKLLEIFWTGHNPVKPVWGRQYLSLIFYHDDQQQRLALESLEAQSHGGMFRLPTQILPAGRFYLAEPYHQKHYLRRHASLLHGLAALVPDDQALLQSTVAARLNGSLAGFGDPALLAAELADLAVPPAVAQQLVSLVQSRRRSGGI